MKQNKFTTDYASLLDMAREQPTMPGWKIYQTKILVEGFAHVPNGLNNILEIPSSRIPANALFVREQHREPIGTNIRIFRLL